MIKHDQGFTLLPILAILATVFTLFSYTISSNEQHQRRHINDETRREFKDTVSKIRFALSDANVCAQELGYLRDGGTIRLNQNIGNGTENPVPTLSLGTKLLASITPASQLSPGMNISNIEIKRNPSSIAQRYVATVSGAPSNPILLTRFESDLTITGVKISPEGTQIGGELIETIPLFVSIDENSNPGDPNKDIYRCVTEFSMDAKLDEGCFAMNGYLITDDPTTDQKDESECNVHTENKLDPAITLSGPSNWKIHGTLFPLEPWRSGTTAEYAIPIGTGPGQIPPWAKRLYFRYAIHTPGHPAGIPGHTSSSFRINFGVNPGQGLAMRSSYATYVTNRGTSGADMTSGSFSLWWNHSSDPEDWSVRIRIENPNGPLFSHPVPI